MQVGRNKFWFPMLILRATWISVNEGGRWVNFAFGWRKQARFYCYIFAFGKRWSWRSHWHKTA